MRIQYFLFLLAFIGTGTLSAQDTTWTGIWDGAIELPGMELEISIEIEKDNGRYIGKLDIPLQHVDNMALAELLIEGDSISFSLPEVPGAARFDGTRASDTIRGDFTQAGGKFPLMVIARSTQIGEELAAKVEQIRAMIDSHRVKGNIVGLGFGLIYEGKELISDGFGYRNLEEKLPATDQTLFAIGSSSKAFTAFGAGLLVDNGLLEWDKPVRDYLPDFRMYDEFATQEMTLVDLLTHRSGLPRHDLMWYLTDFDREELYSKLRYLEPTESFRSEWQYQNLMYMTAGYLIGKQSGKSWEAFTRERIFEPLDMDQANFSIAELQQAPEYAFGYRYDEEEEKNIRMPYKSLDAIGPAGSINASVDDMTNWVEMLLNGGEYEDNTLITGETLHRLTSPQMTMTRFLVPIPGIEHTSYGMGWMIYSFEGEYVVQHGGNIDGFSALVYLLPKEDIGMVILTNQNATRIPYTLAMNVVQILQGREVVDYFAMMGPQETEEVEEEEADAQVTEMVEDDIGDKERRVKGTKYQHAIADYTGNYTHPAYGKIAIVKRDTGLMVRYFGFEFRADHWHYESFKGNIESLDTDVLISFKTDADGFVSALTIPLEPALPPMRFEKQADDRLNDPAFLQKLTGKYELEGMSITISRSAGKLKMNVPGQPEYTLEPYRDTTFKLRDLEGFSVEFVLIDGEVSSLISHQPNGDFRARKVN